MQMQLFAGDNVSKAIIHVPVSDITISAFNPRRQRSNEQVTKLAKRIKTNGFEITRALWAYRNGKGYEVFAGGTRLAAAREAGLVDVPILLHSGYTDEQLIRLADEDNENDEYHAPVSIVDTWLHYKYLSDQDWTQQRIAEAKGVRQSRVSERLKYAGWGDVVHAVFIQNEKLNEGHAVEIIQLSNLDNLFPWLERDSLMVEIITERLAKAGNTGPTAKQFASDIAAINAAITKAQEGIAQLDEPHAQRFLARLGKVNARSAAAVQGEYTIVLRQYEEFKRQLELRARAKADDAERERQRVARIAEVESKRDMLLRKLEHGSATDCHIPFGTKLVLTDPPYGMEFQSNRRTATAKADKLENDDDGAFDLLAAVLASAYSRMADDSVLLVWCGWQQECQFRQIVTEAGFVIRNSIIWNKPNHGSGDLEGSYAPKHERVIHAVKGNPKMNRRHDDVLTGKEFLESEHPTKKPVDLLRLFIEAHTSPGDTVADPFMGAGSTVVAAYQTERDFWGCEISKQWHGVASQAIYNLIQEQS